MSGEAHDDMRARLRAGFVRDGRRQDVAFMSEMEVVANRRRTKIVASQINMKTVGDRELEGGYGQKSDSFDRRRVA